MPSPSTTKLPIPKSWDEFEDIVSDVLRVRWATPHVTRNGRSGQKQHGVDIYAIASHLGQRYAGAQCKHVDALSEADLEEIVEEAEQFEPPLAEFLITTSLPRDAKIQARIRTMNAERIAAGKFHVEILFWDDISLDLSADKKLLAKHFPDWSRLTSKDEEPEFHVGWIIDGQISDELTVTALAADTTNILEVLDPYWDDEIEYLHRVNPRDAARAEAFNKQVHTLAADPEFQRRWRVSNANIAMIDGTHVGVAVSLEKAGAVDILVTLDFDEDIDVFCVDARPSSDDDIALPEHPQLESEQRYVHSSLYDSSVLSKYGGSPLTDLYFDPWQPMLRAQRPYSIYAQSSCVDIRIKRLAPRRSQWFEDKEDRIVISPWCGAGARAVRWRADAENLSAPQRGELQLVIEPNNRPRSRRRQSYIGEPLQPAREPLHSGDES